MSRRFFIRWALSLIVAIPLAAHVAEHWHLSFLHRAEQIAYDLRLRATMPNTVDDRIVIVDIDEKSLAAEGQMPWPRYKFAELVTRMFDEYQVNVAAFDIVFPEPDRSSGLDTLERFGQTVFKDSSDYQNALNDIAPTLAWDQAFAESLKGRAALLGFVFRPVASTAAIGELPAPLFAANEHDTHLQYFTPDAFTSNISLLQQAARGGGFIDNPSVSSDGVFRRAPLLQEYQGALYESLSLATARLALGNPKLNFVFHSGGSGARDDLDLEWLTLGERVLPVDRSAAVLVPYRGVQGSFRYVSATDVLNGTADPQVLKDAIVLVGTSAPGLKDLRVTPVGESYNGVEIHANMISGILDERIKHHPRYVQGVEFLLIVLITLLVTWFMLRLKVGKALLLTLALMAAVIGLNFFLWEVQHFVLPLASSVILISLLYLVHMTYGYFAETRGYNAISQLFGQYVPPQLVHEMSRNPTAFSMKSESREMTVLFTDMRGFTGIAENMSPGDLSELMSECLTPLTDIVYQHRGTIDKYMGDAIMAFWGAPLHDANHATQAIEASINMQKALATLNEKFSERGWPHIRMGIGINTGNMHVGNMGSNYRMAYTVMGDAVNLASRVESLTEEYGVCIAVGEKTKQAVDGCVFLELDLVRVKGKDQCVSLYEPLGFVEDVSLNIKTMVKQHHEALKRFRAREWDRAEGLFYTLSQTHPERELFKLYLDRIAYYRNHPPGESWEAVVNYSTK